MLSLCVLLPALGYVFIFSTKYFGADFNSPVLARIFVGMSLLAGFIQIGLALVLFYAMITIRIILGRNGLQDKINIRMFILNSAMFIFQAISLCIWYNAWFKYRKNYYNVNCNLFLPDEQAAAACDESRRDARTTGTLYWWGSNACSFIANIALAFILSSMAGDKSDAAEKEKSKPKNGKDHVKVRGADDDPERLTEFVSGKEDVLSEMTYTYLGS